MGHPVWGIERRTGPAISLLTYGTLPEGWVQYYPPQAQPQPLREGAEYTMTCGRGRGRFKVTAEAVTNL